MAREQYGLELNPGPMGITTRAAHVGHKYADAKRKGDAFHLALMKAYWMEGRSIEDKEILQEIGEGLGLSRVEMAAAWEDPLFAARVDADRQQAAVSGINGVPAFIFAEKYFASGAQPYEVLKQVIEKLQEEQDTSGRSRTASGD
jgi:predicted DsbA family dithiol-disulfide isomerase